MYCSSCGAQTLDGQQFCPTCGHPLTQPHGQPVAVPVPAQASPAVPAETSAKAIGSLICGVLGWIMIPVLLSIVAIVLGHMSRTEIRESGGRLKGDGLALTGLILGYLEIALIPIILIIAAIAIPNLLRARIAANESSAASAVRSVVVAEVTYFAAHPEQGYTCDLQELVGKAGLPDRVASGHHHVYEIRLEGCSQKGYRAYATPVSRQSGRWTFCATEDGIVRELTETESGDCVEQGAPLSK